MLMSRPTLASGTFSAPPAFLVEYVVRLRVTLSDIGARGLLLKIGITIPWELDIPPNLLTHAPVLDQLLECFRLSRHCSEEAVLLERVAVCHLVHAQREAGVAVLVHLLGQLVSTAPHPPQDDG